MTAITIESTSSVPIVIPVVSQQDPGANNPEFQLTTPGTADPDAGDWVSGSWSGTWNATTGAGLEAVSPLTGATGFVLTPAASPQTLWVRWATSTHTPVHRAGEVYSS